MPTSLLDRCVSHYGLTERQAEVVVSYCQKGNLAAACREVGYDHREAKRLLADNPGFQAAVAEYIQGLYLTDRVEARRTIVKLMKTGESEKVRLDAAKWLDERASGKAPDRHIHEHRVSLDAGAVRQEIRRLAAELNLGEEIETRVLDVGPPELPAALPSQIPDEVPEPGPPMPMPGERPADATD